MSARNFTESFHLKVPLIVAPMAGGPSSPDLVIASCQAGALGSVSAAYLKPDAIENFVFAVREQTKNPILINLFIPQTHQPHITNLQISKAIQATEKYRNQLNLSVPEVKSPYEEDFDQQFETVLKLKPEVFSFVFGLLKPEYIYAARRRNIFLIGTATTLDEALALQDSGVDAITLQGYEAGGHRGLFDATADDPKISMLDLLENCRTQIKVPLIAAGGIMKAADIQKILSVGADAVQLGTAFLACQEAGTSRAYRRALLAAPHRKTKITRAFSGRLARGIENRFMLEMDQNPSAILPFPAQNQFTRDIRTAAVKIDQSDFLSLWAGEGGGSLWTGSVADLIDQLFKLKT